MRVDSLQIIWEMDKLIFISNDDGYDAEGIKQLAEMVRSYGDVFIVAPDGGRNYDD